MRETGRRKRRERRGGRARRQSHYRSPPQSPSSSSSFPAPSSHTRRGERDRADERKGRVELEELRPVSVVAINGGSSEEELDAREERRDCAAALPSRLERRTRARGRSKLSHAEERNGIAVGVGTFCRRWVTHCHRCSEARQATTRIRREERKTET